MLVVEKNLHITWIKEKDSITNLKESEKFSPYSIVESLQPQLNMVRQKGPNLNNLPTWFHKGNGDGTWLLGGYGWMFTLRICGATTFPVFFDSIVPVATKSLLVKKSKSVDFLVSRKCHPPTWKEHLLKKKHNKWMSLKNPNSDPKFLTFCWVPFWKSHSDPPSGT